MHFYDSNKKILLSQIKRKTRKRTSKEIRKQAILQTRKKRMEPTMEPTMEPNMEPNMEPILKSKLKRKLKRKTKRKKIQNSYEIIRSSKMLSGYDMNFMKYYDKNVKKVKLAIKTYSGKHAIDKKIAEEFISSQTSSIRRQAAKDLIDNTIYITLEEIDNIIHQLVRKLYNEYKTDIKDPTKKIYLYCGKIEKSSYFLSVLAMKYINKYHYKKPYRFIENLTIEILDEIGNNPLIIIDDVSYSGSQLYKMLHATYADMVLLHKKEPPNIYILLAALNTVSKEKLSVVPTTGKLNKKKTAYIVETLYDYIPSPFKLLYLDERLYQPIIYTLGIERYLNMLLFFSPYTADHFVPHVSIYLDHKLADLVSTFTTTLLYGPVIPSTVNYNKFKDAVGDYVFDVYIGNYDIIKMNKLVIDFNEENNTSFTSNEINRLLDYSFDKLIKNDKPDSYVSQLTFKPFINTCNSNPKLLQNMNDPEIINFDYFLFTIPEGCLENKDCQISYANIRGYAQDAGLLIEKEAKTLKDSGTERVPEKFDNALRINNKINSIRCPIAWYKKGECEMSEHI
jgi:hypothetical protein